MVFQIPHSLVHGGKEGCCILDLSPSTLTLAKEVYAIARVNELQALDAPVVLKDPCEHDAFGNPANVMMLVGGEDGAIVPWGFAAGGGWFAFDAPAAPLEHGAWYDWEVDLDLSSDAAPAIRYRLGGAALLRAGAEWLPLPGGVAHATGVVFRGDGAIGDFKGVYAGGRIVGEPVVPAFGGGSPLAFGTDPGTGGPTFSMTVVNAVEGCYYTVFAASALGDDFVAEKDGEPAPADGTLVLTAPAGAPARFFRIVVSTFPVEAGTLFSSLPLSP